jgi:hypothetical protein
MAQQSANIVIISDPDQCRDDEIVVEINMADGSLLCLSVKVPICESKFGWLLYRYTTHVQLRASDPLFDF